MKIGSNTFYLVVNGERWTLIKSIQLPATLQTKYRFSNGNQSIDVLVSGHEIMTKELRMVLVDKIASELKLKGSNEPL